MSTYENNPVPQRRSFLSRFRPRFSLRTMLIIVTIVCVSLPWIVRSERQRRVGNQIETYSGIFYFANENPPSLAEISAGKTEPKEHRWYQHYFNHIDDVSLMQNLELDFDWAALPHLKKLNVMITTVGKEKINLLSRLQSNRELKKLSIADPHSYLLSDQEMEHLPTFQNLEDLEIRCSALQESGFAQIGKLKKLRSLRFEGSISPKVLSALQSCSELASLDFSCDWADAIPETFNELIQLKTLRQLSLTGPKFIAEHIAPLGSMTNLTHLTLTMSISSPPPEGWLKGFANMNQLQSICIMSADAANKNLKDLAHLPALRRIDLWDCIISTDTVDELAKFSQLETLGLRGTGIIDDDLERLVNLTQLKKYLGNTKITSRGIDSLLKFTNLERLDLGNIQLNDEDLLRLKALKKLKVLGFSITPMFNMPAQSTLDQLQKAGIKIDEFFSALDPMNK
jgi:hypothetical protein